MFDNTKLINRMSFLIASLAVGIIVFSLVNYVFRSWFIVDKILVNGNFSYLNANTFKVALQNKLYGNLFTIDLDNLQDDFKQIPWVHDVTITRQFPNTIEVNVSEYNAVAKLSDNELISSNGKVIFVNSSTESLPFFDVAIKNSSEALTDYDILKPILKKRNLRLVELKINDTGIFKIILSNNLEVTICGTDFVKNIMILDEYWDRLYKLNPHLSVVNMCYKNGMAINSYNPESAADVVSSK